MEESTVWVGTRNSWPFCSPPISPSAPGNQAPGVGRMWRWPELHPSCHFLGGALEEGRWYRGPGEMGCEVVVQLTRISAAGRREAFLLTLPTLLLGAGSPLPGELCPAAPGGGDATPGNSGWEDARPHVPQRPVESLSCSVSASQITLSSAGGRGGPAAWGVTTAEEGTVGWGSDSQTAEPRLTAPRRGS